MIWLIIVILLLLALPGILIQWREARRINMLRKDKHNANLRECLRRLSEELDKEERLPRTSFEASRGRISQKMTTDTFYENGGLTGV